MIFSRKRKKIISLVMLFVFLLFPLNTMADSLNRGDVEIQKSGDELRDEISGDTQELDTHGVKEIGDKAGDFYEAYKEEFDTWAEEIPGGEVYRGLIENYNYQHGNFECGKFDVMCHIVNFGYVTGASVVNAFLAPISKLAIEPEKILNDNTLNKFKDAFNTFTVSLLAVFVAFQIIKTYAFRMTNHSDTGNVLSEKVIKVSIASILLFGYDFFFQMILNIQYRVNYGIYNYLTNSEEVTSDVMLNMLLTPNGTMFVIMILLLAILIAVLFFQMIYSFAMVSLFYVVGPVAITTMVNDDYNMFNLWLKTIISRFLTLALQGMAVVLCLSFASRIDFITEGSSISDQFFEKIAALAFLVVGISIPTLLKEFGNSSGSGKGVISGTKSVTRYMSMRK